MCISLVSTGRASDRHAHLDSELKGLQMSLRELETFLKWLQEAETTVNVLADASQREDLSQDTAHVKELRQQLEVEAVEITCVSACKRIISWSAFRRHVSAPFADWSMAGVWGCIHLQSPAHNGAIAYMCQEQLRDPFDPFCLEVDCLLCLYMGARMCLHQPTYHYPVLITGRYRHTSSCHLWDVSINH